MSTIHINYTKTHEASICWRTCTDCQKRSPMVYLFQEWYGWDITCMRCGRSWQDGEWMPLDFLKRSREKSKQRARKRYKMFKESKEIEKWEK